MNMKKILLLAGTKKGLFLFTSGDRRRWQPHGPFLKGKEINHAIYDARTKKIFATANDAWVGSEIVSAHPLDRTRRLPSLSGSRTARSSKVKKSTTPFTMPAPRKFLRRPTTRGSVRKSSRPAT